MGIGAGAGGAGVLHTSGNAVAIPMLALCCVDILLTTTVEGISYGPLCSPASMLLLNLRLTRPKPAPVQFEHSL